MGLGNETGDWEPKPKPKPKNELHPTHLAAAGPNGDQRTQNTCVASTNALCASATYATRSTRTRTGESRRYQSRMPRSAARESGAGSMTLMGCRKAMSGAQYLQRSAFVSTGTCEVGGWEAVRG